MTADANPLIQNDLRPIRGWSIVIFLAVLPLLLVPAVWLLGDREMLAMLALFFISSLIALAVAVAPHGLAGPAGAGFSAGRLLADRARRAWAPWSCRSRSRSSASSPRA